MLRILGIPIREANEPASVEIGAIEGNGQGMSTEDKADFVFNENGWYFVFAVDRYNTPHPIGWMTGYDICDRAEIKIPGATWRDKPTYTNWLHQLELTFGEECRIWIWGYDEGKWLVANMKPGWLGLSLSFSGCCSKHRRKIAWNGPTTDG